MISFWQRESFYEQRDFIIVGAGLAGLWCAYELRLKFDKANITIIDKGIIPGGASTRNAGFACFGSPTEMLSDITNIGADAMWKIVESRYKGIKKIRSILGDDLIQFDPSGGYECFSGPDLKDDNLQDKVELLNKGMKEITNLEQSFNWSNHKIKELGLSGFASMIENALEGSLNSGELVKALMHKVASLGVTFLFGTQVFNWTRNQNVVSLNTSTGKLTTSQLIICTNALAPELNNIAGLRAARGQVLVTSPIEGLKLRGTFHYDEGYYYFRNIGNRILIGGARNKDFEQEYTSEIAITPIIQNELEEFMNRHIEMSAGTTIEHRWGGIMGFTENKLPMISKLAENVLSVVACNGMGVALTPIIAEQVAHTCKNNY